MRTFYVNSEKIVAIEVFDRTFTRDFVYYSKPATYFSFFGWKLFEIKKAISGIFSWKNFFLSCEESNCIPVNEFIDKYQDYTVVGTDVFIKPRIVFYIEDINKKTIYFDSIEERDAWMEKKLQNVPKNRIKLKQ